MADLVFITLLFVHILFVVAWLGAALFGNLLLFPVMPKLSPQGRSDLAKHVVPRAFRYGLIAGSIAMADGVLLYTYINFINTSYATSAGGLPFIQIGAAIALVGMIATTAFQSRTTKKIEQLSTQIASSQGAAASQPSSGSKSGDSMQTMARLQNQSKNGARVGALLLIIVLILMVAGANI